MSSLRGGRGTSRGRGTSTLVPPKGPAAAVNQTRTPRAGFSAYNGRGRGTNQLVFNGSARGGPKSRATTSRGGSVSQARGGSTNAMQPATTMTMTRKDGLGGMPTGGDAASYQDRFQALKKKREQERAHAIAQGLLADPDKPRTLAEAITPVGTCPDMCAEFERLERIVQNDVWAAEQDTNSDDGAPAEHRMVKKFRRAAAGIDEQLPSDLRPPSVLKATCDYLFNDVVGTAESLGAVHHFVWDRTRAIRNDFSIQQVTKPADLAIAIECYERIARFHILSLHQLAVPEKPYEKYDWYQEREQLDRTLLSLMQYYDDTAGRLESPNEPEFRAYCVIFQAQDPNPDLEERVNAWELRVRTDPRVRKSLDVYNAACNILDPQGPLKPRAVHPVAQEDWGHFFRLVSSDSISYLTACVSEIYFNLMRRAALNAIWRSFRPQSSKHDVTDFTESVMTEMLGFDEEDQVVTFCQYYGFVFKELSTVSEPFLDLNSVQGRTFPSAAQGMPHQTFSDRIVEVKRAGRTFPAIISGLSVVEAQQRGLIEEVIEDDSAMEDEESLFVPDDRLPAASVASPFSMASGNLSTAPSPFAQANTFASPAIKDQKSSPFASALQKSANPWSTTPPAINAQGAPFSTTSAFALGQDTAKASGSLSAFGRPSTEVANNAAPSAFEPSVKPVFATSPLDQKSDQSVSSPFGQQPFSPFSKQKDAVSGQSKPSPFAQTSAHTSPAAEPPKKPAESFSFLSKAVPETGGSSPLTAATQSVPVTTSSIFSTSTNSSDTGDTSTDGLGASANTAPPKQSIPTFSFTQPSTKASNSNANTQNAPSIFASQSEVSAPSSTISPQSSIFQQAPSTSSSPSNPFSFGQIAPKDVLQTPNSTQDAKKGASSVLSVNAGSASSSTSEISQQIAPSAPSVSKPLFNPAVQPNQPRKPSPLSQSFSATEESPTNKTPDTPFKPAASSNTLASDSSQIHAFAAPQASVSTQSLPPKLAKQVPPPKSKKDILQDVAREATFDRDTGFVRQYVEFHARQVILEVYDELYAESLRQLADNFRNEKLSYRYGKRWRDICWRRRLVRQGREKRRRTQKHQHAKELEKQLAAETNAVDDFLQSMHVNKSRSVGSGQIQKSRAAMAPRPLGVSEAYKDNGGTAPLSKHADHLDGHGRVSKPQAATVSTPGRTLSRLNGTTSTRREPVSTTRSNYFRLRALGIDPNGAAAATPSARKRAREVSSDESVHASPVPRKTRLSSEPDADTSLSISPDSQILPNPTNNQLASTGGRSMYGEQRSPSAAEQQDEALFARARAARQALKESAAWYRSEVQKDEAQRGQEVSRLLDSPSMQRAREQARLRASGGSAMSFGSSVASAAALTPRVPAYRLRESKFVPRERYGQPVERKQNLLSSPAFGTPVQEVDLHSAPSPAMGSVGRVFSQKLEQMGERAANAYTGKHHHFGHGDSLAAESSFPVVEPSHTALSNGSCVPDMIDPGLVNDYGSLSAGLQGWASEALNGVPIAASVEGTESYESGGEEDQEGEEDLEESDDGEQEVNGFDVEEEESDDGFEEEEEFEDEAEGYRDEDEDVEESEESDGYDEQDGGYYSLQQHAVNGDVPAASVIKAGTGTADDAFELSD